MAPERLGFFARLVMAFILPWRIVFDGALAARVVHEGCKRAVERYLKIEPVRGEAEGSRVTLEPGFDAARNTVTGNVVGEPPFTGELVHPGWRATAIDLPTTTAGHDASILAPAEIEL